MAESMSGFTRSHRCTEVLNAQMGESVVLMGWVNRRRNLGSLIFVDLRDRTGLIQLLFDENNIGAEGFAKAETLRNEFVIAVRGLVQKREGAVNESLPTGEIEIKVLELRILSEALTPPFPIEEDSQTKDELRLKYRYLDLRRPDLQKNIILRSRVAQSIRNFMSSDGFIEIETPMLCKSTPEGARDYLVPSRVHPGSCYALPQSPQLFKQLLMCAGYDRYYQLAKCFRDEDLRADRQPEFTQIDMEFSFANAETVMETNERLIAHVFKEILDVDVELPIQRMTWQEAMERFGSDKPDTRFGMELVDVTDCVKGCEFSVFANAAAQEGSSVRGITAKGMAGMPRKKIDALTDFVKGIGAKGLAYLGINEDGTYKSSFAKFMKEEELAALAEEMKAEKGDMMFFAADTDKIVFASLGALRLELGAQMGLIDESKFNFLWVTEFPLLEYSDEQQRWVAMHHPFTMPLEADISLLETEPWKAKAAAYDIVLNGVELGGGSERIYNPEIQEKMFTALGFTKEEAYDRFGFLLDAFKYGVPPHAGLAYGFDRLMMLMTHAESIRDVIAFPKVKDASCLMTGAPTPVDKKQLKELDILLAGAEIEENE
ncbi:MAG: aspartate--tRNA ligase [Lachnospiraceae bacterium]|nr:aspartate--tRNA ligase [Lachnospiraceae bacterium]